jgi:hypothetical protein
MYLPAKVGSRWHKMNDRYSDGGKPPPWLICGSVVLFRAMELSGSNYLELYDAAPRQGERCFLEWRHHLHSRLRPLLRPFSVDRFGHWLALRTVLEGVVYLETNDLHLEIDNVQLPETVLGHLPGRRIDEVIDLVSLPAISASGARIKEIDNTRFQLKDSVSVILEAGWRTLALMPYEIARAHRLPRQRTLDVIPWLGSE